MSRAKPLSAAPESPPVATADPVDDVDGVAAAARTPNQCLAWARAKLHDEPEVAFARLNACSRRPDFDIFDPLLFGSWLRLLEAHGLEGLEILARAVAVRRQAPEDIPAVRSAGFRVLDVNEAEVGDWVLALGSQKVAGSGVLAELGYFEANYSGDPQEIRIPLVGSNATGTVYAGRMLRASRGMPSASLRRRLEPTGAQIETACRVEPDHPHIVLGVVSAKGADLDAPRLRLSRARCFPSPPFRRTIRPHGRNAESPGGTHHPG